MFLLKKNKWTPKHIGLISALAFMVLLVFYKSEFKVRFLDWGLGLVLIGLIGFFTILKGRLEKKELAFFSAPLLWVVFAFASTPFVFSTGHHLHALLQATIIIVISMAIVVGIFSRTKLLSQTVFFTVAFWCVINTMLFLAWYTGNFSYVDLEFAGIFENRNEFAINTVFLMALACFFSQNLWFKLLSIACSLVLLIASRSSTGFLAFLLVIFYPYFLKTNFIKKLLMGFLCVSILLVGYFYLEPFQQRVDLVFDLFLHPERLTSGSVFLRAFFIFEGLRIFIKNPLWGVGVDNSCFFLFNPNYSSDQNGWYSHNNYIEMLLNAGFPGFFLHYLPIVFVYFKTKKNHRYYHVIKTFSVFYFFLGISSVQYNFLPCVISYQVVIFLYLYYGDEGGVCRADFQETSKGLLFKK